MRVQLVGLPVHMHVFGRKFPVCLVVTVLSLNISLSSRDICVHLNGSLFREFPRNTLEKEIRGKNSVDV